MPDILANDLYSILNLPKFIINDYYAYQLGLVSKFPDIDLVLHS